MPRTREHIGQAARDAERWLDERDPTELNSPDAETSDLAELGSTVEELAAGEERLTRAVATARAHGRSWTQIAAVLGVSRQSARERFAQRVEH
jgi:hypothetical protein